MSSPGIRAELANRRRPSCGSYTVRCESPAQDSSWSIQPHTLTTHTKSFNEPDRVIEAPGIREEIIDLGQVAIGRVRHGPGWRWSTHTRPTVGTDRCESRHVGCVLSGRLAFELPDGTVLEVAAESVYDIPPRHDAWTIGDEPVVLIEWVGAEDWIVPRHGERVLTTLLFTDIVGSTRRAASVGERRWRALISAHDESIRQVLIPAGGREVDRTGDGFLATFEGPARAIQTAIIIRERVRALGLELRQGLHVGEIELVGRGVRGLAVHEAARIMAAAEAGEIYLSSVAKTLAAGSGYSFSPRGARELKGLPGIHELFAVDSV